MTGSGGIINRLRVAMEGAGLKKATEDESLEYDTFMTSTEITALFENMCPETPNFLSANKQRDSEISRLVEPEFFYGYNLSLRTALVEATNANSSFSSHYRVAVHLHLLACIIALGSDAEEATSTWETIVALRMSGHAVLRRGITRSQLAMWDSSARAWLATGDRCMSKEKSQLESLLQHVELELAPWKTFPIIAESYTATQRVSALINAWLSALTIMENLTSGQPQEVQDGEVLRVFPAFHLYPDVYVFGSCNVEAHMHDAVVPPRGVLTVDLGPGAKAPSNKILRSVSIPYV